MQQSLSKFFVIKTLLYALGFLVLVLLYTSKTQDQKDFFPLDSSLISSSGSLCFNTHCFAVEIANTPSTREYGLMNRTGMALDQGMLFIFEKEALYPFWMKNTLIPLDIIWMDAKGKVVDIKTVHPCTTDPCPTTVPSGPALYVLEVNADISKFIKLQTGDQAIRRK